MFIRSLFEEHFKTLHDMDYTIKTELNTANQQSMQTLPGSIRNCTYTQELVECSQSMHFFICSKSVVFPEVKFCVLNVALRLWTSLTKAIRQSKPGRRIVLSKPTLEKIGSMNQNTITF